MENIKIEIPMEKWARGKRQNYRFIEPDGCRCIMGHIFQQLGIPDRDIKDSISARGAVVRHLRLTLGFDYGEGKIPFKQLPDYAKRFMTPDGYVSLTADSMINYNDKADLSEEHMIQGLTQQAKGLAIDLVFI